MAIAAPPAAAGNVDMPGAALEWKHYGVPSFGCWPDPRNVDAHSDHRGSFKGTG